MAIKKSESPVGRKLFLVDDAGALSSAKKLGKNPFIEGQTYETLAELEKAYENGNHDLYDGDTDLVLEIEVKAVYQVKNGGVSISKVS